MWFLRILLVWFPQSSLSRVTFFRRLEFVKNFFTGLRRKFETNQGKPSVDSARKVRKRLFTHKILKLLNSPNILFQSTTFWFMLPPTLSKVSQEVLEFWLLIVLISLNKYQRGELIQGFKHQREASKDFDNF